MLILPAVNDKIKVNRLRRTNHAQRLQVTHDAK